MARISLNTNLASLGAQRNLAQHTSALVRSFDRLSSGLRINRAADDSAGLAVASLLDIDRRVYNQSVRNLNDGINYLGIAEGAVTNLTNIIVRIRELAEQSSNGVLGNTQRQALQQEVTALEREYNRLIKSTSFNGKLLLTGNDVAASFAAGYGANGLLNVTIGLEANSNTSDNSSGTTTRGNVSSSGAQASAAPDINGTMSMSADGRYVVFTSAASNLVTGDTNGANDIFLRDSLLGTTTRVSVASDGTQANGASLAAQISADGAYVVYSSNATNLVAGDTNGRRDIFRYEVGTGRTERVNLTTAGSQSGLGDADDAAVSGDGRYVVFHSSSHTLVTGDTNGQNDVFMRDMLLGTTTRVSVSSSGAQTDYGYASYADISADGRYVTFVSTAGNLGATITDLDQDVYVHDMLTGESRIVSNSLAGTDGNGASYAPRISADGRYVSFYSDSTDLVSGDTNGHFDIFAKDLLTGTMTRVSVGANGVQGTGDAYAQDISADGRYISFSSDSNNLVSGDTNGEYDTFIFDSLDRTTRRVSVRNNGAQTTTPVVGDYTSISADGRYVAFYHGETNLVSGDTNGVNDLFIRDTSVTGVQEISGMVVSDQASARATLDLAKRYQEEVQGYLGQIGAAISRASAYNETLKVGAENFAAAKSQITDADFAEESAKLVSVQILQRATSAVLAQANLQPQLALQLLQGL